MSQLEELQHLLLGDKKAVLDGICADLNESDGRARLVAQALPDAIHSANQADGRLAVALQEPVTVCIKSSIQRDSKVFADALYPAMGPAIRKSISETLKQFVQSLNQVLEHSISIKGLRWRLEAWRSGIPFAQVVLKNTLLYRVEESYLIQRESGLLIEHVSADVASEAAKDQDAVSAMLTAIQDFVRDTFSADADNDLDTLDMGSRTLWVIRGPSAMMACVISGIPPSDLRDRLRQVLEDLHESYRTELAGFNGDRASLSGVTTLLEQSLLVEAREPAPGGRRPWAGLAAVVLLLLGLLGGVAYLNHDPLAGTKARLIEALRQEPGMVVLDTLDQGAVLQVRGMRDPLARPIQEVASQVDADQLALDLRFVAFQSLETRFIERRARRMLGAPPGVVVALEQGVLRVSGAAPPDWNDRYRLGFMPPTGVDSMDFSALEDDRALMLSALSSALDPPQGVELSLEARRVRLSGMAGGQWLKRINPALREIPWLDACDTTGLASLEWSEARRLADALKDVEFVFVEGVSMQEESKVRLRRASETLQRLKALVDPLGSTLQVYLKGFSDAGGTRAWNIWLRHQRADTIRGALESAGLPRSAIHSEAHGGFSLADKPNPRQRRVTLRVELGPRSARPDNRCR